MFNSLLKIKCTPTTRWRRAHWGPLATSWEFISSLQFLACLVSKVIYCFQCCRNSSVGWKVEIQARVQMIPILSLECMPRPCQGGFRDCELKSMSEWSMSILTSNLPTLWNLKRVFCDIGLALKVYTCHFTSCLREGLVLYVLLSDSGTLTPSLYLW